MSLRVLIGGEYSGTIRDAFTARGHYAMSCDFSPTTSPGPHYQGDWADVEGAGWDLAIFHRTCTFMANSGAKHIYAGMNKDNGLNEDRWLQMGRDAWAFWKHRKTKTERPVNLLGGVGDFWGTGVLRAFSSTEIAACGNRWRHPPTFRLKEEEEDDVAPHASVQATARALLLLRLPLPDGRRRRPVPVHSGSQAPESARGSTDEGEHRWCLQILQQPQRTDDRWRVHQMDGG